jgi:nitrate/nitrite-specific signal transduction histidine kinase
MDKPKGGRGHKAPYRTTHLRVPDPIKDRLQAIIDQWREETNNGEDPAPESKVTMEDYIKAIKILENSLTLKANAGGKIKTEIREALAILKGES